MTQSLVVAEDIRKTINMIDEIQHHEVDEALGDLVPKKIKTWWTGREKKAGQRELEYYVNQNFKWLGLLMGRQDIDWTELSFGNMRHFFKASSNRIGLTDAEVDKVFAKVQKQFNRPNTEDDSNIDDDEPTSQAIVKGLLKQGIVQSQAKQGLGSGSQKASAASNAAGAPPAATSSPSASPASVSQPPSTATTSQNAATAAVSPPGKPFDPKKPDLIVDHKGRATKVWKVPVSKAAPAGWIYWDAEDKLWVTPPKDSQDATIFNQQYAAKKMTEAVSTKSQVNNRLDDLVLAKRAEQQGDKALQYEKLADYHEKFSKVSKLTPADRIYHTTQAGIYRNAAQAVQSAQLTLSKSSK
tara:strand:- start:2588 stop:3652 length:1065 start_codon:yes stop_codon:yes gene_type:complete